MLLVLSKQELGPQSFYQHCNNKNVKITECETLSWCQVAAEQERLQSFLSFPGVSGCLDPNRAAVCSGYGLRPCRGGWITDSPPSIS